MLSTLQAPMTWLGRHADFERHDDRDRSEDLVREPVTRPSAVGPMIFIVQPHARLGIPCYLLIDDAGILAAARTIAVGDRRDLARVLRESSGDYPSARRAAAPRWLAESRKPRVPGSKLAIRTCNLDGRVMAYKPRAKG